MQPFVLYKYNSNNAVKFHTTTCVTIQKAQNGGTINNFVRVPAGKKLFIMHNHTLRRLTQCQNCINDELAGLTGWNGVMPTNFIWPDCFLLYVPAAPSAGFHFMLCSNVKKDIDKGWTDSYRFTNKSWFEDYNGNIINVQPCQNCLLEWNNGNGWNGNFDIYAFFDYCLNYRKKNKDLPPDLK